VGKWRGLEHARPAGLGSAARTSDHLVVAALLAVNAFGDIRAGDEERVPQLAAAIGMPPENTTIGVVVTNAILDKTQCRTLCTHAHDGLARALDPVHTAFDGDAVVVAATGAVEAHPAVVAALAAAAVEAAVRDAVRAIET
jgi:L-aminopeptidase/D-esterase-like protein